MSDDRYIAARRAAADRAYFRVVIPFAGRFKSGDLSSPPFSINLVYSKTNEFPPFGYVTGNEKDYRELEIFFLRSRGLCELEGISKAEGREIIKCNCHIKNIGYRHYPEDERQFLYHELSFFDVIDFDVVRQFVAPPDMKRHLVYFLNTPREIWQSHCVRMLGHDGTTTAEMPNKFLDLELSEAIRVEAAPHFVFPEERSHLPYGIRIEGEAFAISMFDEGIGVSDEDFAKCCDEIIERLFLITSFITKSRISWYARWFVGCDGFAHRQNNKMSEIAEVDLDDAPILREDIRKFIRIALNSDRKLSLSGIDVKMPILLYVGGNSGFIEEQYISLFRYLEKMVDMLAPSVRGLENLTREQLHTIREFIETTFCQELGDKLKRVIDKLPDLRRAGFLKRLVSVLNKYDVIITDIGGGVGLEAVYKVRNALIHKATEPEIEEIVREHARLQAIVDRLLIHVLGWDGRDGTPTYRGQFDLTKVSLGDRGA